MLFFCVIYLLKLDVDTYEEGQRKASKAQTRSDLGTEAEPSDDEVARSRKRR